MARWEMIELTYHVDLTLNLAVGNMTLREHVEDGLEKLLVGDPVEPLCFLLLHMLLNALCH